MSGLIYLSFYNHEKYELEATSAYDAQLKAVEHFKPPKSKRHMVSVHLVEKDGEEVIHTPTN